ncbi:MAG TPA: acyl carrier protein [Phycisphaerae bacterium]|nr:acyl carrier protein [Phycisphaerae bacterium]HRW53498.1 acyl carrier protein [Phycisphaerae bacterium]
MSDREKVRDYIFETLLPTPTDSRPGNDANLFDFGLDSLRLMQLLVFVEQSLGVNLPDHEMTPERVETIDAIVEWIGEHR